MQKIVLLKQKTMQWEQENTWKNRSSIPHTVTYTAMFSLLQRHLLELFIIFMYGPIFLMGSKMDLQA